MGANFSLNGEDGAECFEGVDSFKYLERILYQVDEYWLEVIRDIQRSRQVWERLGKFLRR